jgi:hypothetical protein
MATSFLARICLASSVTSSCSLVSIKVLAVARLLLGFVVYYDGVVIDLFRDLNERVRCHRESVIHGVAPECSVIALFCQVFLEHVCCRWDALEQQQSNGTNGTMLVRLYDTIDASLLK